MKEKKKPEVSEKELKMMENPDIDDFGSDKKSSGGTVWIIISWLSVFMGLGLLVPLLIWVLSKNKRVKKHGKISFAVSLVFAGIISGLIIFSVFLPGAEKEYTSVSWNDFETRFRSSSSYSEQENEAFLEEIEGKWINGTGSVWGFEEGTFGEKIVILEDPSDFLNPYIWLYIDDDYSEQASSLQEYDELSFSCEINYYLMGVVMLKECKILSIAEQQETAKEDEGFSDEELR